jgi:ATP synthase F1 gamma subunit
MESVSLTDEQFAKATAAPEGAADAEGAAKKSGKRQLMVCLTTDRGLCGSVNSTLARVAKGYIKDQKSKGFDVSLVVLGEKGRTQIVRDNLALTRRLIDAAFDKEIIFPLAAAVAEKVVKEPFDVLTLVYNRFETAAKFVTTFRHFPQLSGLPVGVLPPKFKGYGVEPDNNEETLVNLMEYSVAGALYYTLLETKVNEIAQRVTAMDNASTNASDMVDRFQLIYNRARQAKITTELTEIISGAESIADAE